MSFSSSFSLSGRRALITGSSRGIGTALATGLAEAGADVLIHCVGRPDAAELVAERITATGRISGVVQADLASPDAATRICDAANKLLGGVDILILNASIQQRRSWMEFSPRELDAHYAVNYRSSYEILQQVVPGMCRQLWGRILTIGSVQERRPHPEMLPYSSLKHAQTALTLGLAKQLAGSGVTINALAPGVILTDRNTEALSDPDYADQVRASIPAGRFGSPNDCVGAALLLCSDAGAYITGQNLFIDGGLGLA